MADKQNLTDANLHIFQTAQQLGVAAAEYVAHLSEHAIATRGRLTVALSGGSLPKILFPALVNTNVNWSKWHVFWADERCLPLTDPESNYYLARKYLFEHVSIPPAQIYSVDDTLSTVAMARAYQSKLKQIFSTRPRFDLILLGMGEDGHTASLFPKHALLQESNVWMAPIFDSPKPPPERITFTLPVINNARQVAFISTGKGKAKALLEIIKGNDNLPAQRVHPARGDLHWFVDTAAASAK